MADYAMEVEGSSLDDLFETAAAGMAALMVDPQTIGTDIERHVTLEAPELDLLLHEWLSELIFRKDRDREIFPKSSIRVAGNGPFRATAVMRGGTIDPERTELGIDAKAVALHELIVEQKGEGWRARVVIDV